MRLYHVRIRSKGSGSSYVTEFREYSDFAHCNVPPLGGTTNLFMPQLSSFQVGSLFYLFLCGSFQVNDLASYLLLASQILG